MLRRYQLEILEKAKNSANNDIIQLDTGGGKTHIIAALCKTVDKFIVVAHRNILITQISKTLAQFHIAHNAISTRYTRRRCIIEHRKIEKELIDESINNKFVASIDSIIAHHKRNKLMINTVDNYLIIIDEAHHVVADNKWGKLKAIFPNSRIIGFTATPCRLDGKSLHSASGGIFDCLIQADDLKTDSVKTLINKGFLSDFKVYTVPSDFDYTQLKIGKNNDYTQQTLDYAVARSTIIGDAVKHYKKLANNKQAVAMCVSIKNAEETAHNFRKAGVSAACISSNMSSAEISRILDAFLASQIKVLCNVDMVGEGFDVPNIECLIMLRKTNSFVSYRQWIGRALRPLNGKQHAIIIDHVGNVFTHNLPDFSVAWDIQSPPLCAQKTNLIACENCHFTFYGWLRACPACGAEADLRRGAALGNYHVDLNVVNLNLCEAKRQEADKEIQYQEHLQQKRSEVIPLKTHFHSDIIGNICNKLRNIAIDILPNLVGFEATNEFIHDTKTDILSFWINNFSRNDLKNPSPKKFLRVYKKWQKSK